jgi:hypothetical protein
MTMKKYRLLLFAFGGFVFGEDKVKFDNFVYRKM